MSQNEIIVSPRGFFRAIVLAVSAVAGYWVVVAMTFGFPVKPSWTIVSVFLTGLRLFYKWVFKRQ